MSLIRQDIILDGPLGYGHFASPGPCIRRHGKTVFRGSRLRMADPISGISSSIQPRLQILETRPDLACATGLLDRSSAMHRAAATGHVDVMRAVVESLRAFSTSVIDPSKGDVKVRSTVKCCAQISHIRCGCLMNCNIRPPPYQPIVGMVVDQGRGILTFGVHTVIASITL